jgi:hypothetical protein
MTLIRRKSHFINGRINGCPRDPDNPCGKKNRTIELRKQCRVEVVKQRINGRQRIIGGKKQKTKKTRKTNKQPKTKSM